MSKIVTSERQALTNIRRFRKELDASPGLQGRLSFARAWYAYEAGDGMWRFGPSKFIGYEGMTADEYLDDDARDGRRTEKQLAQWFVEVPEGTDLHEKLSGQLSDLLDQYGKVPSAKMRINVQERALLNYAAELDEEPRSDFGERVNAVLVLTEDWPKTAIERLRKALAQRS